MFARAVQVAETHESWRFRAIANASSIYSLFRPRRLPAMSKAGACAIRLLPVETWVGWRTCDACSTSIDLSGVATLTSCKIPVNDSMRPWADRPGYVRRPLGAVAR
jgi:hypothetical protein